MSLSPGQANIAKQGKKAVFIMLMTVENHLGFNPFIILDFFGKVILPILTYGCEFGG